MGLIRLLFALLVVLSHSYSIFKINIGGVLAVQSFFIISGFYISLILNEKYINQNDSYKLFITNRFMRIFPLYGAVMLIAVLFSIFAYINPSHAYSDKTVFENPLEMCKHYGSQINITTIAFLLWTNLCIFFQDMVMFLGVDASGSLIFTPNFKLNHPQLYKFLFIPQGWSVALELTFYLIAPFLVRKNFKIIISIVIFTFAIRFLAYYNGFNDDPWTYRFFPFELGYFLLGNISYHIYKKIQQAHIDPRYQWYAFAFILLLTFTYPLIKFTGSQYMYSIFFTFCLPFVFLLTKGWKYDSYIGDLSYPIYLVHILVLSIVTYYNENYNIKIIGIVYITSVIGFSVLLNELISKKIEKIRQRRLISIPDKEKIPNSKFNQAIFS